MSEASREKALSHAVAVHAGEGYTTVLEAAEKFHAFISGDDAPAKAAPAKTAPAKAAATAPAKKPAVSEEEVVAKTVATNRAKAKVEEEAEEASETTLEQVETIIADLLGANMRNQVKALLGEFGAKSASSVKAEDRTEFLSKAGDLLLGA